VSDQTENGSCFRILTLLDEHTRQCLAIHPGGSIRAVDVITVVEAAIARYGAPENLRSDNGPRVYRLLHAGLAEGPRDQDALHQARSPWENGHIESFHDKLRDECLNRELFGNLREARVILESWRLEYNERRPHSSLGYRTRMSMPRAGRTGLMGAARPQPRAARRGRRSGGTKDQCHKVANKRKPKH
jgi:putative transposase